MGTTPTEMRHTVCEEPLGATLPFGVTAPTRPPQRNGVKVACTFAPGPSFKDSPVLPLWGVGQAPGLQSQVG